MAAFCGKDAMKEQAGVRHRTGILFSRPWRDCSLGLAVFPALAALRAGLC